MISYLKGKILARDDHKIYLITNNNSVGYGVYVNNSALAKLNQSSSDQQEFWIHTAMSQDALKLFGFLTAKELITFEILITVPNVGAKLALSILDTLSPKTIFECVKSKDVNVLQTVSGIGNKKAQKILLELSSKIDQWPKFYKSKNTQTNTHSAKQFNNINSIESHNNKELKFEFVEDDYLSSDSLFNNKHSQSSKNSILSDVKSALGNLGYSQNQVDFATKKLSENSDFYKTSDEIGQDSYKKLFSKCFSECCRIIKGKTISAL